MNIICMVNFNLSDLRLLFFYIYKDMSCLHLLLPRLLAVRIVFAGGCLWASSQVFPDVCIAWGRGDGGWVLNLMGVEYRYRTLVVRMFLMFE